MYSIWFYTQDFGKLYLGKISQLGLVDATSDCKEVCTQSQVQQYYSPTILDENVSNITLSCPAMNCNEQLMLHVNEGNNSYS